MEEVGHRCVSVVARAFAEGIPEGCTHELQRIDVYGELLVEECSETGFFLIGRILRC